MPKIKSNEKVLAIINEYPDQARDKILAIRSLIIEAAEESDYVDLLTEDVKWSEPSYLTKSGSTIRIAWKASKPDKYGLYFHCQTELIRSFRKVFRQQFTFESNRAIIFNLDEDVPETELKTCLSKALEYHKVKHLPLLGL